MPMYECTYMCMHIYDNVHDYECVFVIYAYAMYVCTCMNVHMCIYVICNVCMFVCVCIHVCVDVCL